jgi:hypothetical protein
LKVLIRLFLLNNPVREVVRRFDFFGALKDFADFGESDVGAAQLDRKLSRPSGHESDLSMAKAQGLHHRGKTAGDIDLNIGFPPKPSGEFFQGCAFLSISSLETEAGSRRLTSLSEDALHAPYVRER